MRINLIGFEGYSKGWQTVDYRYGVCLLWYRPERRLSVSIGAFGHWRNIRLYGPKKLSFEK